MLKATGSYRTYSIPGKTAALIPEFAFAVEDLPSPELQPGSGACSEGSALGQNTLMMMMILFSDNSRLVDTAKLNLDFLS